MDYNNIESEKIEKLIKIFQRLLNVESGEINEDTRNRVLSEIRAAKLEIILNRD